MQAHQKSDRKPLGVILEAVKGMGYELEKISHDMDATSSKWKTNQQET